MKYQLKEILSQQLYEDILTIYNADIDFSVFKDKSVLITGGEKPLGFYLACAFLIANDLAENNTKVFVVGREKSLFEKYGKINSREDIDFAVSNYYSNIQNKSTDYIIHTDSTVSKDYFENIKNIFNYCNNTKATSMVFCDDMQLYGSVYNSKSKILETDEGYVNLKNEKDFPIQAQRMAETFGKQFALENQLNIKFARLCHCISTSGFSDTENNSDLVAAIGMGVPIKTDEEIKSFCYVTDMAEALLWILLKGENNSVYNVSSGCDTSTRYIADVCRQLYPEIKSKKSEESKNISNDYSVSPLSTTRFILDNSELLKLGFKPKVSLAEGIKRMIKIALD